MICSLSEHCVAAAFSANGTHTYDGTGSAKFSMKSTGPLAHPISLIRSSRSLTVLSMYGRIDLTCSGVKKDSTMSLTFVNLRHCGTRFCVSFGPTGTSCGPEGPCPQTPVSAWPPACHRRRTRENQVSYAPVTTRRECQSHCFGHAIRGPCSTPTFDNRSSVTNLADIVILGDQPSRRPVVQFDLGDRICLAELGKFGRGVQARRPSKREVWHVGRRHGPGCAEASSAGNPGPGTKYKGEVGWTERCGESRVHYGCGRPDKLLLVDQYVLELVRRLSRISVIRSYMCVTRHIFRLAPCQAASRHVTPPRHARQWVVNDPGFQIWEFEPTVCETPLAPALSPPSRHNSIVHDRVRYLGRVI